MAVLPIFSPMCGITQKKFAWILSFIGDLLVFYHAFGMKLPFNLCGKFVDGGGGASNR